MQTICHRIILLVLKKPVVCCCTVLNAPDTRTHKKRGLKNKKKGGKPSRLCLNVCNCLSIKKKTPLELRYLKSSQKNLLLTSFSIYRNTRNIVRSACQNAY